MTSLFYLWHEPKLFFICDKFIPLFFSLHFVVGYKQAEMFVDHYQYNAYWGVEQNIRVDYFHS